jgi:hypothetical protein
MLQVRIFCHCNIILNGILYFVVPLPLPLPTPLAIPLALGIPLPRVLPLVVCARVARPLGAFGVPNLDEAFELTGGCSTNDVSVVLHKSH